MASSGIHFSLASLPEKYQAQVARKLSDTVPRATNHQEGSKGVEGGFRAFKATPDSQAKSKGKRCRVNSPVRMTKNGTGPNKTEAQFNRDVLEGLGKYEAVTLHLPSNVKYTPDYLFEHDGVIYMIEIKGSYHLPTHGRSVMAFKIACAEFPMFTFLFAELGKDGRTWTIGRYKDGEEIATVCGTAKELSEME